MVTPDNNNKFYEMVYEGGSTFTVNYGRVEQTRVTDSKPINRWDSVYKEKLKKGYKDMTYTVATTVQTVDPEAKKSVLGKIADSLVDTFMSLMHRYTNNLVTATYSVKAEAVSQAQVDEAQAAINILTRANKKDSDYLNRMLLELYSIIPRRMRNVRDHLLPSINLDKTLQQEQDNLDAMAAQVNMSKKDVKEMKKEKKEVKNLLDVLGLKMKTTIPNPDIQYLLDQIGGSRKIAGIFEVQKDKENKTFDEWMTRQKNRKTRILIHGTRCTSVIPILEQGLKIRPAGNFQFSGKVYGDGNYYSETVNKSLNYTGGDPDKVLLVYEVHVGNPFVYDGWYKGNSFTLNYKNLQERGFDSTFVKAGGGLLNSEIIAYDERQNRIKYIIWLR